MQDGRSVRHTVGFARVALAVRTTSISGHAASGARRRRRFSCRWGLRSFRILALSWGRWSWSIHRGGIHSGDPSLLMRQVQPFCRKWVWVIATQQGQVANTALNVPGG